MEIDDNLHYAAHAQKLVRTVFEQFEPVLPSSLNWFEPIWTSLNQFELFSLTIYTTLLMHN